MIKLNKFVRFLLGVSFNEDDPEDLVVEVDDLGLLVGYCTYDEFLALNISDLIIHEEVHKYMSTHDNRKETCYWIIVLKNKYVLPFEGTTNIVEIVE